MGSNQLELGYTNKYDNTGSGFHRFVDPEDNEVYIHTDFEPIFKSEGEQTYLTITQDVGDYTFTINYHIFVYIKT